MPRKFAVNNTIRSSDNGVHFVITNITEDEYILVNPITHQTLSCDILDEEEFVLVSAEEHANYMQHANPMQHTPFDIPDVVEQEDYSDDSTPEPASAPEPAPTPAPVVVHGRVHGGSPL